MKKIAYVSNEWFADTDMTVLHILAREFEVDWIYEYNKKSPRIPVKDVETYCKKFNINLNIVTGRAKYLSLKNFKFYHHLYKAMGAKPYDLIYTVGGEHLYRIPFDILFGRRNKFVHGLHDVQVHSGEKGAFITKFVYWWENLWCPHFITYSPSQFEIFKKLHPSKRGDMVGMSVKNLGVPTVQKPNITDGVRLLFFGRIDSYKGLDLLINSLEELYARGNKNIYLSICGKGPHWQVCEGLIKSKSQYNLNVRFIENNEIPDIMMSHHFLVLPYRDATQSGPIMIAAKYGLPIIAPDFDCFTSIYNRRNSGLFYQPGNIGEALENLLGLNEQDYSEMVNAAATVGDDYSEDKIGMNYINCFNRILQDKY